MLRGDSDGALAAVEEHLARFRDGKLGQEREALRIQALVTSDRDPGSSRCAGRLPPGLSEQPRRAGAGSRDDAIGRPSAVRQRHLAGNDLHRHLDALPERVALGELRFSCLSRPSAIRPQAQRARVPIQVGSTGSRKGNPEDGDLLGHQAHRPNEALPFGVASW